MNISTPEQECGVDSSGEVKPCINNKLGPVSVNCVLLGFDPPPMLRPNVTINTLWSLTNFAPFVQIPAAGTAATYSGLNTTTPAGNCLPPYVLNAAGAAVSTADSSINSPMKCRVAAIGNAPLNTTSQPANSQCYDPVTGNVIMCP